MERRSLLVRAYWILTRRPTQLWAHFRGYALFCLSACFRRIFLRAPAAVFAPGVRLQRLRSIVSEAPNASIMIGQDSIIYEDSRLEAYGSGQITVGAASIIGGAKIVARERIQIGARFLSSWNVFIQDFDPHPVDPSERADQVRAMVADFRPRLGATRDTAANFKGQIKTQAIIIGDDVWVGAQVTILKGANIGSGSVVAAGAVVVKGDYPERALIAGNPARVIKML